MAAVRMAADCGRRAVLTVISDSAPVAVPNARLARCPVRSP
ncbi:hypothetical protein [Nocardia barduliensis]|nr:hypothetical protein [Nocardia barduliensis]